MVTDVVGVLVVSLVAVVLGVTRPDPWPPNLAVPLAATVVVVSLAALRASRSWARRALPVDVVQLRRVAGAFAATGLILALGGLALKLDAVRPWVFVVLPATAVVVLAARWAIRGAVHRARARGRCRSSLLVVGPTAAAAELVARARRASHQGWTVVAVCAPRPGPPSVAGVPVVGEPADVVTQVRRLGVDLVAVTGSGRSPADLRRLAWQLEGTGAELAVDPGLREVPGARLHVSPVDGLPMLRLAEVRLGGGARLLKHLLDRVAAALLLVLLAPVLLAVAVLVAADGGPVLFRQERVGRHGRPFRMLKFRTMVVDAERQLDTLADEGAGPLFKLRRDPRVTPVGVHLRRLSLDELPQLCNVVAGSMSLVGPRPALPREVAAYADDDRRRLVVRPGITGLWQISGRSDLSWEDTVRLDLRYVESWSPGLDAAILCRTVGAVLRGDGAY